VCRIPSHVEYRYISSYSCNEKKISVLVYSKKKRSVVYKACKDKVVKGMHWTLVTSFTIPL